MNDPVIANTTEPDGAPRIAVLDILRGIAILGILFMNINDMGGSIWNVMGDVRYLGWSGADQIAWWVREIVANGTARGLLEMLFGAGMVILTERGADAAGAWVVMRRYYWRNVVLWLFGLVHLFVLLWPGDILHTYAVAALLVFLVRRLPAGWLLAIGLLLAGQQLLDGTAGFVHAVQTRATATAIAARHETGSRLSASDRQVLASEAATRAGFARQRAFVAARVAADDKARSAATGSAIGWITTAWGASAFLFSQGLEISFIEEAASAMAIGIALFKWGIIQGERSRWFYGVMTISAYAVGITLRTIGAIELTRFDDLSHIGGATSELARLAMTIGHIGLVNLVVTTAIGAHALRPFVAAGRTALSIYIAQTLICLWVLYPPFMLGLYGTMSWAPLMLTALAIDVVLLWLANIWVRHFRISPVEWAWRSIVAGRRLAWRSPTNNTV